MNRDPKSPGTFFERIAVFNKAMVGILKEAHAPKRWSIGVLRGAGLPTQARAYIAAAHGGGRSTSEDCKAEPGEPLWPVVLATVVTGAGLEAGSREHLAATLLVMLAFKESFARDGEAGKAAEASFRAGLLWQAARRDDDATIGRRNLKLGGGPSDVTLKLRARAIASVGSVESPFAEAVAWAEAKLQAPRESTTDGLADAEEEAARGILLLHQQAEQHVLAGEPDKAASFSFDAGELREAVRADPHAVVGQRQRRKTRKGGRSPKNHKNADEAHGRWWLMDMQLRQFGLRPNDRARAIEKELDGAFEVVRKALRRMKWFS